MQIELANANRTSTKNQVFPSIFLKLKPKICQVILKKSYTAKIYIFLNLKKLKLKNVL